MIYFDIFRLKDKKDRLTVNYLIKKADFNQKWSKNNWIFDIFEQIRTIFDQIQTIFRYRLTFLIKIRQDLIDFVATI